MASILCKYYVQNEESEFDTVHSNLFVLSQKFYPDKPIKYKDVLTDFPLAQDGKFNYHLRFETVLPGSSTSTIWVDILNPEAKVPCVSPGLISIKALRLPPNVKTKLKAARPEAVPNSNEQRFYARSAPIQETQEQAFEFNNVEQKKQPEVEEEFDLGTEEDKKPSEEKRPRLDSDVKKAVFELNLGEPEKQPEQETLPTSSANNNGAPTTILASMSVNPNGKNPAAPVKPPNFPPAKLRPLAERIKDAVY